MYEGEKEDEPDVWSHYCRPRGKYILFKMAQATCDLCDEENPHKNDYDPDLITWIQQELRRMYISYEQTLLDFAKECDYSYAILQKNRHRSCPPYEWFGPDPEPRLPAGSDCECQGCTARFALSTKLLDRDYYKEFTGKED